MMKEAKEILKSELIIHKNCRFCDAVKYAIKCIEIVENLPSEEEILDICREISSKEQCTVDMGILGKSQGEKITLEFKKLAQAIHKRMKGE